MFFTTTFLSVLPGPWLAAATCQTIRGGGCSESGGAKPAGQPSLAGPGTRRVQGRGRSPLVWRRARERPCHAAQAHLRWPPSPKYPSCSARAVYGGSPCSSGPPRSPSSALVLPQTIPCGSPCCRCSAWQHVRSFSSWASPARVRARRRDAQAPEWGSRADAGGCCGPSRPEDRSPDGQAVWAACRRTGGGPEPVSAATLPVDSPSTRGAE